MDFLRSFDLHIEGASAFGAIAYMLSFYARQSYLCMTMGAFAVDVGLAVFPFVSAQKKPLLRFSHAEKILSIFLRSLGCISGKHAVEHECADHEGKSVQCHTNEIVFDEYRQYGDRDINDEQCAGKRIRAVSAPEESRQFLFHGIRSFLLFDMIIEKIYAKISEIM